MAARLTAGSICHAGIISRTFAERKKTGYLPRLISLDPNSALQFPSGIWIFLEYLVFAAHNLASLGIYKKYAGELDAKVRVFSVRTKTRKTIFPTMVTTYGTRKNDHYTGRTQAEIVMEDLFT